MNICLEKSMSYSKKKNKTLPPAEENVLNFPPPTNVPKSRKMETRKTQSKIIFGTHE